MGTWGPGLMDNDTAQDTLWEAADGGFKVFSSTVSECLGELKAGFDEATVDMCSAVTVLFVAANGSDYGPSVNEALDSSKLFRGTLRQGIASKASPSDMHALAGGIVAYANGPTLKALEASDEFIAGFKANAEMLRTQTEALLP